MNKKDHSFTVGGNINWYWHYREQFGGCLKTKNRISIWPSNPTSGHIPWENHNSERDMYHNVNCSTIYNNQDMEATYVSINRWMDKEDVAHIYNGILLSHKKNNNAICSSKDGPGDYHAKWSQLEKDKHHMVSLTCGI